MWYGLQTTFEDENWGPRISWSLPWPAEMGGNNIVPHEGSYLGTIMLLYPTQVVTKQQNISEDFSEVTRHQKPIHASSVQSLPQAGERQGVRRCVKKDGVSRWNVNTKRLQRLLSLILICIRFKSSYHDILHNKADRLQRNVAGGWGVVECRTLG